MYWWLCICVFLIVYLCIVFVFVLSWLQAFLHRIHVSNTTRARLCPHKQLSSTDTNRHILSTMKWKSDGLLLCIWWSQQSTVPSSSFLSTLLVTDFKAYFCFPAHFLIPWRRRQMGGGVPACTFLDTEKPADKDEAGKRWEKWRQLKKEMKASVCDATREAPLKLLKYSSAVSPQLPLPSFIFHVQDCPPPSI